MQAIPVLSTTVPSPRSLDRDRQCPPLPDQRNQPLAARHPRVDQVPLQHRVMLFDVSVEITIEGSEMRLHFDSPPQVRAGINMIYTALLSSVYYAVKAVVDPTILPNSGLAPDHRDRSARHDYERETSGRRQWPN